MPSTSPNLVAPSVSVLDPGQYNPDGWQLDLETMPTCPDSTRLRGWEIDAKLWEGRFRENGSLDAHRVRRFDTRSKVRAELRRLREIDRTVRRVRESSIDWFAYGGELPSYAGHGSPLLGQYIPLLPGPATRQQYWADYFATSAKAFEAWTHDPIVKRSVLTTTQFALGRGVEARPKTDAGKAAWEDYEKRNDLSAFLEELDRNITIFGELFIRYFPIGATLVARSLDPATIYEIVTDQEDAQTVFFYHQQFSTRSELYAPPAGQGGAPQGPTTGGVVKYVVRQIPAGEIDHFKINTVSGEVRGRSDLFASLGYVKRLRDLITSRVVKSDMESRMAFKLTVDGDAADVTRVKNSLFPGGRAPNPGSVLAINKTVDLEAFVFNSAAETGVGQDIEAVLNLVAVGLGVPKEYLGVSSRGTRANALVATEPAAKRFEDRQGLLERILHQMAVRVFDHAQLRGEDREIEFIFPDIVSEDRSGKLKDLAYAESNQWISKESAASTAAKELGYTTYEYEAEQTAIAEEFTNADEDAQGGTIRRPMIAADARQVPKLDPTRGHSVEDLPPGNIEPADGGDPAAPGDGGPAPRTRSGFPGDENPLSRAGAANIRRDNQLRESAELVARAVREAVDAGVRAGRAPRRRPDDPEFQRAAAAYRSEAHQALTDAAEAVGALNTNDDGREA